MTAKQTVVGLTLVSLVMVINQAAVLIANFNTATFLAAVTTCLVTLVVPTHLINSVFSTETDTL